jgi:hypothetical protein
MEYQKFILPRILVAATLLVITTTLYGFVMNAKTTVNTYQVEQVTYETNSTLFGSQRRYIVTVRDSEGTVKIYSLRYIDVTVQRQAVEIPTVDVEYTHIIVPFASHMTLHLPEDFVIHISSDE